MDPDPIYFINLQDFFCLLLFEGTFNNFSKIKSQEEDTNSRNLGFFDYLCLMIEGSGSRRPKNIRIRQIRIRIRNTASLLILPQTSLLIILPTNYPPAFPTPNLRFLGKGRRFFGGQLRKCLPSAISFFMGYPYPPPPPPGD
jgi:hypothetical protein